MHQPFLFPWGVFIRAVHSSTVDAEDEHQNPVTVAAESGELAWVFELVTLSFV